MSRLPALAALLTACASGAARIDGVDVPDAPHGPDAPDAGGDATLPLLSASVGGGCDASLETPPNNACDGEPVLGLDLVSVRDAGGDGVGENTGSRRSVPAEPRKDKARAPQTSVNPESAQ